MATKVSGKVIAVTADRDTTIIQLDNDPAFGPKDNKWNLKLDHANYKGLFALALAAAANRWTLTVRIEGGNEIDTQVEAGIKYLAVGW